VVLGERVAHDGHGRRAPPPPTPPRPPPPAPPPTPPRPRRPPRRVRRRPPARHAAYSYHASAEVTSSARSINAATCSPCGPNTRHAGSSPTVRNALPARLFGKTALVRFRCAHPAHRAPPPAGGTATASPCNPSAPSRPTGSPPRHHCPPRTPDAGSPRQAASVPPERRVMERSSTSRADSLVVGRHRATASRRAAGSISASAASRSGCGPARSAAATPAAGSADHRTRSRRTPDRRGTRRRSSASRPALEHDAQGCRERVTGRLSPSPGGR